MKYCLLLILIISPSLPSLGQARRSAPKPTPTPGVTLTEATTSGGKRVLLKSDHTWDFAAEAPLTKPEPTPEPKRMSIPVVYDDPDAVANFVKTLDSSSLSRSEFDTEDDYAAKLAKIKYPAPTGSKPLSEITLKLRFRADYNAELEKYRFEYNAVEALDFNATNVSVAVRMTTLCGN